MKHLNITLFLFALMSMVSVKVNAYDVRIDGICYNLDSSEMTATVTARNYYYYGHYYSGSIAIPNNVTYGGREYRVKNIDNRAFDDCSGLTSVTIPNSVTSIGSSAFRDCI